MISELSSGIHILRRHLMFRVLGWETRRAAFFRFRERLVVLVNSGRHLHLGALFSLG